MTRDKIESFSFSHNKFLHVWRKKCKRLEFSYFYQTLRLIFRKGQSFINAKVKSTLSFQYANVFLNVTWLTLPVSYCLRESRIFGNITHTAWKISQCMVEEMINIDNWIACSQKKAFFFDNKELSFSPHVQYIFEAKIRHKHMTTVCLAVVQWQMIPIAVVKLLLLLFALVFLEHERRRTSATRGVLLCRNISGAFFMCCKDKRQIAYQIYRPLVNLVKPTIHYLQSDTCYVISLTFTMYGTDSVRSHQSDQMNDIYWIYEDSFRWYSNRSNSTPTFLFLRILAQCQTWIQSLIFILKRAIQWHKVQY